jgi:hypothetical protein
MPLNDTITLPHNDVILSGAKDLLFSALGG